MRLIGEWPLLPVVHRANVQQLLGVVSLDDVMRAYRGAGMQRNPRPPRAHRSLIAKRWRENLRLALSKARTFRYAV